MRGPFSALLNAEQHPALHDEVRGLEHEQAQRREHDVGLARPTCAYDQARRVLRRLHHERAPAAEDEYLIRLDALDLPTRVRPEEASEVIGLRGADKIAGFQGLPLGMDPVGI